MKKIIVLSFLAVFNTLCFTQTINVPSKLEIDEGSEMLDDTERVGFSVVLAGDEKEIIRAFEDFLSAKGYDIKSLFKKISAENILVPAFSEKHFNLYAQTREFGTSLKLWYWVSLGPDNFVNSDDYPEESKKCLALLKDFSKGYYTDFINEDLTKSNELLVESREELADVADDIADLNKDQLKEKKKREKLKSKELKLQGKLSEIQEEIKENQVEIAKQDEEITNLETSITEKSTLESSVKSKIAEQESTIKLLKEKLILVEGF